MEKITLPWMNKIRERKLEYLEAIKKLPIDQQSTFSMIEIDDFLEPIITYGEKEEKKINKEILNRTGVQ